MDMLIKLDDRAGIGPRLAFALIGIVYGTLLYLIILAAHEALRRNTGTPQRRQENGRHI
jgi:flagellar motor component MotA